jgi:uncharacterized DUF497 family protein
VRVPHSIALFAIEWAALCLAILDVGTGFLLAFRSKSCYRIYIFVTTKADVEFAWDERKNRINKRKHGVSFETASLVFDDPYHLTRQDREVEGEPRWQTIGIVNGVHVLLVAHTVSEDEEQIRILSARKATRRERSMYAQSN